MTDHAPSVVAPALDEAAETFLAVVNERYHGRSSWARVADADADLRAALRAESVAAPAVVDQIAAAIHEFEDPHLDGISLKQRRLAAAIAAALHAPPALDVALAEDGRKWRAAEAEGHVVDFSEDGYGLRHPPSCRPGLIECRFNVWLADLELPAMPPGRYRMVWDEGSDPRYEAADIPDSAP